MDKHWHILCETTRFNKACYPQTNWFWEMVLFKWIFRSKIFSSSILNWMLREFCIKYIISWKLFLCLKAQNHSVCEIFYFYHIFSKIMVLFLSITDFMSLGTSYPLETLVKQIFSGVFRGYRKRPVAWNGLVRICRSINRKARQ